MNVNWGGDGRRAKGMIHLLPRISFTSIHVLLNYTHLIYIPDDDVSIYESWW
jgi:hypothetical protein